MSEFLSEKYTSIEAALRFLAKRNPFDDMPQHQYVTMLMDFQDAKGDAAVEGLAGFYIYAIDNKTGEDQTYMIRSTFGHDLGGAKDEFLSPRSTSYRQFWQEEYSKYY